MRWASELVDVAGEAQLERFLCRRDVRDSQARIGADTEHVELLEFELP